MKITVDYDDFHEYVSKILEDKQDLFDENRTLKTTIRGLEHDVETLESDRNALADANSMLLGKMIERPIVVDKLRKQVNDEIEKLEKEVLVDEPEV